MPHIDTTLVYTNFGLLSLKQVSKTKNKIFICSHKRKKLIQSTESFESEALKICSASGNFIVVTPDTKVVTLSKNGTIDYDYASNITSDHLVVISKKIGIFGKYFEKKSAAIGLKLSGESCNVSLSEYSLNKDVTKRRVPTAVRLGDTNTQLAFLQAFFGKARLDLLCHSISIESESHQLMFDVKLMLANFCIHSSLKAIEIESKNTIFNLRIFGIHNLKQFLYRFKFQDADTQKTFLEYCEAENYYDNDVIYNLKKLCDYNHFGEIKNDEFHQNYTEKYLECKEPAYTTLQFVQDNLYNVFYDKIVSISSLTCTLICCNMSCNNELILANGVVASA